MNTSTTMGSNFNLPEIKPHIESGKNLSNTGLPTYEKREIETLKILIRSAKELRDKFTDRNNEFSTKFERSK